LESDSPTSSTTERETIVHGVILSVCWCAQPPLHFAAFLLSFPGEKINQIEKGGSSYHLGFSFEELFIQGAGRCYF
jgi:hypothetical protein